MNKVKLFYASSIAAVLTIVVITAVTILGELSGALKTYLAGFTGHHWLTKSLLSIVVYFAGLAVFYFLPKNTGQSAARRALMFLILIALAGSLAIFLFFVWHYLRA